MLYYLLYHPHPNPLPSRERELFRLFTGLSLIKKMKMGNWEKKYSLKTVEDLPEPACLLKKNTALLSGGKALDIAMGMGQNSIFLASKGFDVTGIDLSSNAVNLASKAAEKKGVKINAVQKDILTFPIEKNSYDLIINFNFLEREIIDSVKNGLKKRGLVFFETYTMDLLKTEPDRNPDFLLKPNELLKFFLDFLIVFYHEKTETRYPAAGLIAMKL